MNNTDVIKGLLATYAWHNSRQFGGSAAGTMMMWALANRVRKGMADWVQAINHADRYMQTEQVTPLEMPPLWDAGFLALAQGVDDVYDGRGKDMACGGLFWADTAKPVDDWFLRDICRNPAYGRVAQMGSLVFYGEPEKYRV